MFAGCQWRLPADKDWKVSVSVCCDQVVSSHDLMTSYAWPEKKIFIA